MDIFIPAKVAIHLDHSTAKSRRTTEAFLFAIWSYWSSIFRFLTSSIVSSTWSRSAESWEAVLLDPVFWLDSSTTKFKAWSKSSLMTSSLTLGFIFHRPLVFALKIWITPTLASHSNVTVLDQLFSYPCSPIFRAIPARAHGRLLCLRYITARLLMAKSCKSKLRTRSPSIGSIAQQLWQTNWDLSSFGLSP